MSDKPTLESLEKRIAALEAMVIETDNRSTMMLHGLITGLSPLQLFFREADRRMFESVPVNPIPRPDIPPLTVCETRCETAYRAAVVMAGGDAASIEAARQERRECNRACRD